MARELPSSKSVGSARGAARLERFERLADVAAALHELARAITSLRRLVQDGGQLRVLLVQVDPGLRAGLARPCRRRSTSSLKRPVSPTRWCTSPATPSTP
jgi:hypothetical protein